MARDATPAPGSPRPTRDGQAALTSIIRRFAALNIDALTRVEEELAGLLALYVSSAVAYNRILETLRDEVAACSESVDAGLEYRSADGRTGVRIGDLTRLHAMPWQSVCDLTRAAFERHASAGATLVDLLGTVEAGREQRDAAATESARRQPPPVRQSTTSAPYERIRAPQSLIEGRAPTTSTAQPDRPLDAATIRTTIEQHSREISQLREQLDRHVALLTHLGHPLGNHLASDDVDDGTG
jgi:hypothetical protein